jgi:3-hydroxyisobutyrate dehydrogenase
VQFARPVPSEDDGQLLFVGLGAMGAPMASRLARAGYLVRLCDADDDRAGALARDLGVASLPHAELTGAAEDVATVVLMLPDTPAVEGVLEGAGLLAALAPGTTVVDMGSSTPGSTVRLAAAAAARGIPFVDAPVSGGVARAVTGELAIMVGAEPEAFAAARPMLEHLGAAVSHVGAPGAGHAMKALNNLLSAVGLAAASEVLAVGRNFGLDPQVMLDVLNSSSGRNQATEVKMARFVLSRAFDSGFALRLMVKDLRTALDLAHETGTPVPLGASCLEEWTAAARTLPADADHTAIAAYVEARAGTELR